MRDQVFNNRIDPPLIYVMDSVFASLISSVKRVNEFTLDLLWRWNMISPQGSRALIVSIVLRQSGFKQSTAVRKINKDKDTMLLDFSAEISIIDTTFALKVWGWEWWESDTEMC